MVLTIRRRYVQISTVAVLSFFLILMSFSKGPHMVRNFNYVDSLSLSVLSTSTNTATDMRSGFNKKVTKILEEKRKHDREDKFWAIDTELTRDQTDVTIPSYFQQPESSRPIIGPFDPRFTLGFYYSYISRHPEILTKQEIPFHWSDWVDMTPLNKYLFAANKTNVTCADFDLRPYQEEKWPKTDNSLKRGAFDPKEFCRAETEEERGDLGFSITDYFGRVTPESSKVLGKAFLYSSAPNPYSITFLTKEGSYTVEVQRKKSGLLQNGLVDEYLSHNKKKTSINTLDEFRRLQKIVPPSIDEVVNDYEITLDHSEFIYEPAKVIRDLEESQHMGPLKEHEVNYMNSVKYSIKELSSPPKYFNEAKMFSTLMGDHYDWRFFSGFKHGNQEQANTLHRMVRSWLSFTRKQGIVTWMAHGSLLSWYWNGVAFPWDNDIDVQVPVMDLHKLSMRFNQSLIVEDSEDGFGRYFLDCGTFIATRHHSNGNNNIDARFIDIDSGMYIDITGLAVTSDSGPDRYLDALPSHYVKEDHTHYQTNDLLMVYNCRNRHFASHTELSPLIKTFVEGEIAYVPKRYSDILSYEYHDTGMMQKYFGGRLFIPQLRLWIHQDKLRFFMRHREAWRAYYGTPEDANDVLTIPRTAGGLTNKEIKVLLGLTEQDYLDLLLSDELLVDYISSRELTSTHETEIMKLIFGKSTQHVVSHAPDFKPLMYEPFLFRLNRDYATFDSRVALFERLHANMVSEISGTSKSLETSQISEISQATGTAEDSGPGSPDDSGHSETTQGPQETENASKESSEETSSSSDGAEPANETSKEGQQ